MSAGWNSRSTPFPGKSERGGFSVRQSQAPRNNEGAVVGEGADRISADNIGHQLLSKMGWTSGQQIGRGIGGLDEPLSAIVKTSKAVGRVYPASLADWLTPAASNQQGLGSGFVRYNRGEVPL